MVFSVDWVAKEITIPLADLTLVDPGPPPTYEHDLTAAHLEFRRLEWGFNDGLWAPQILQFTTPKSFSGIILQPILEVINGYELIYEDVQCTVLLKNANSNFADVTQYNQVRIIPFNSAGNSIVETPVSGLTPQESADLAYLRSTLELHNKYIANRKLLTKSINTWYLIIYDDDDSSIILQKALKDVGGNDITDITAGLLARELKSSV